MNDGRFPKRVRLLRASEFDRVFAARNSASDGWIMLYGATGGAEHARLGLTVSRRYGGAVQRNRWKRLMREAFRSIHHELPPLDLVCLPRGQAPPMLTDLCGSLTALSSRIKNRIDQKSQRCDSNPL